MDDERKFEDTVRKLTKIVYGDNYDHSQYENILNCLHDLHPDPPQEDILDWCHCGHCSNMPTQEENKCCARVPRQCITTTPLFPVLILDGNVLDIAMRYREDMMALNNTRNNESFRHAAYRQFVLWQHGRLGKGNRRVVPSCCVLAIHARYPSPNGIYTGYRPS